MFDEREYDRNMIQNLLEDLQASQNPIETLRKYEALTGTSISLSSLFELIDLNSPPEAPQLPSFLKEIQTACEILLKKNATDLTSASKPQVLPSAFLIDTHSKTNPLGLCESSMNIILSEDSTQLSIFNSPLSRSKNAFISLKRISSKVYEIVRKRSTIDPVSVANQLVKEVGETETNIQKNIKRRAYDAINVMLASGVVQKDGRNLYTIKNNANDALSEKRSKLRNLIETFSAYKNLTWRNSESFNRKEMIKLPALVYSLTGAFTYSVQTTTEGCLMTVQSTRELRSIAEIDILKTIGFKKKSKVVPQEVYNLIR